MIILSILVIIFVWRGGLHARRGRYEVRGHDAEVSERDDLDDVDRALRAGGVVVEGHGPFVPWTVGGPVDGHVRPLAVEQCEHAPVDRAREVPRGSLYQEQIGRAQA